MAISAFASACGSSGDPQSDATSSADVAARYGYDPATATVTPVYALVPEFGDPRDAYARDLLARQCLQGVMDFPVVVPGSVSGPEFFDPRTHERHFDEEIAAQWGYQISTTARSPQNGSGVAVTAGIQSKMEECGKKTKERLGVPPERMLNGVKSTGWNAVETSDEVKAAAGKWRACMAPAGVIDLPDDPHGMPSASVATPGSQSVDGQGNTLQTGVGAVSARERQVAVADARCRAGAGFDSAELRVRAEAELDAIGRDIEGFESARREFQEYAKGVDQVIEELG